VVSGQGLSVAKKTKKKTAKKATASRAKTAKKPASSKKKTTKKTVAKKTAKKAPAKKTVKKKTTTKTVKKKTTKKTTAKKAPAKKAPAKKAPAKKTTTKTKSNGAAEDKGSKKKKKTETKKKKKSGGKKTGRSVAEVASAATADEKGYVFINGRRVRMISTKGKVPTRKSAATYTAEPDEATTTEIKKPIKTTLSRKELNHFRDLLLAKRAELVGDLTSLETEALRSSGGDLSHMPIHMADIGSDTYEQDLKLGLAENERERLREIDDALARIQNNTYGVCQMTGKPIPNARLEAKPWAKYTIEAARQIERGWGP
jgi:RNA polymerase-binding protein DksA